MSYETPVSAVLPPGVIAASRDPFGDISTLLPGELSSVASAVASRKAEFAAGRDAARCVLGKLGFPPIAIPAGHGRAPLWPPGITGSISHCQRRVLAIAAKMSTTPGYIGIDIELVQDLEGDLWESVCSSSELSWVRASDRPGHAAKLLFSIKEAVYKAQYQQTGRMLDFHDVEVVVRDTGRFSAAIIDANHMVTGRYGADNQFIVAYASTGPALEG